MKIKVITFVIIIQIMMYPVILASFTISNEVPETLLVFILFTDLLFLSSLIFNLANNEIITTKFNLVVYAFSTLFSIFVFALLYNETGIKVGFKDVAYDFETSFYFSAVTWTSLGYGDVSPTIEARKWVMLEVFFGYFHMSVVMGFIMDSLKHNRT